MSREGFLEAILLDVDGPQLIVVRDAVGASYLGLLAERSEENDTFLCTAVSPGRLTDLRHTRMDLRAIFLTPEVPEYFVGRWTNGANHPPRLDLTPIDAPPEDWLPEEGFFLHDFIQTPPAGATTIVAEATARHRAILHVALNPPEAREGAQINMDRLAIALQAFQNVVRHAYRRAIAELPESARALEAEADNYLLEVFAFAPGSFEVRLQSKAPADLMGFSNLSRAMKKIDELIGHLVSSEVNLEAALEVAQQNRGHLIGAYQNLLKFVAENEMPMTYSWADPSPTASVPRKILPEAAAALYALLVSRQDLGTEQIALMGRFVRADVRNGSWTLLTEDGKEHRGQLAEGYNVSLSGIVLDTRLYRIECEERIEETLGSGRQTTNLFLRELQALDSARL